MDQIRFNDDQAIEEFRKTIAPTFRPGLDVAIARWRNDNLMGGVVFSGYYKDHSISVQVHSWRRYWLNRDLLFVVFDYAFNQLNVKHIFADTREDKAAFDYHVGFRPIARIENFYPDTAKIILRMDREDCRWLELEPRHIRKMH